MVTFLNQGTKKDPANKKPGLKNILNNGKTCMFEK